MSGRGVGIDRADRERMGELLAEHRQRANQRSPKEPGAVQYTGPQARAVIGVLRERLRDDGPVAWVKSDEIAADCSMSAWVVGRVLAALDSESVAKCPGVNDTLSEKLTVERWSSSYGPNGTTWRIEGSESP